MRSVISRDSDSPEGATAATRRGSPIHDRKNWKKSEHSAASVIQKLRSWEMDSVVQLSYLMQTCI
jgi:hypothetical protein